MIRSSPLIEIIIQRDSGVFLYIGGGILDGLIPYTDIWDHKPPLIYYINAFGILLGGESRWGVWIIEYVSILVSALFSFQLIKHNIGIIEAVIGTSLWLFSLPYVLEGGNLPEEYGLVLQFFAIYIFLYLESRGRYFLYSYGIGVIFALLILLKPTLVGICFSIVIIVIFIRLINNEKKLLSRQLLHFISGIATIFIPVFLLLISKGAFFDFWDAVMLYNITYNGGVEFGQIRNIYQGFIFLSYTTISFFGLMELISSSINLIRSINSKNYYEY